MAAMGSNSPAFTSPALAMTRAGPDVESARASASRSIEPAVVAVDHQAFDPVPPEAQHGQGLRGARVHVPAGPDRHRREGRRAGQPVAVDVDAVLLRPPRAGRGQGREVGRRGTGGQDAAPRGGKVEEVEQPPHRRDLELPAERGRHPRERVLVDGRCQPVGGERGGRDATRHEVEEPRAGRGVGAVEPADQLLQRRRAADPVLRQRHRRSCGPWRPRWPSAPAGRRRSAGSRAQPPPSSAGPPRPERRRADRPRSAEPLSA